MIDTYLFKIVEFSSRLSTILSVKGNESAIRMNLAYKSDRGLNYPYFFNGFEILDFKSVPGKIIIFL